LIVQLFFSAAIVSCPDLYRPAMAMGLALLMTGRLAVAAPGPQGTVLVHTVLV